MDYSTAVMWGVVEAAWLVSPTGDGWVRMMVVRMATL
jgi:hypothetical protein